ncbi:MAG: flippase-like domain-containing protein [Flavobacteriales bacterium]|nr:flippase-like domain-containing protein [Flavobacteriales bacterium]
MSVGRVLLIVFRWGIFLLACAFLYTRFSGSKGIEARSAMHSIWQSAESWPMLWAVFLMMLLNWFLESYKWRMLMVPVESIPPWRAFLATIAGTSVGLVTINRTGELLGRILFLSPGNRIRGAFSTALGSIAQFVVTLFVGGVGLILLINSGLPLAWNSPWMSRVLVTLTALCVAAALTLYLSPGLFRQVLVHLPILRRLERASVVLDQHTPRELRVVLLLSMARYAVFGSQFIWLLIGFGAGLPIASLAIAITVVYLIATLVPTVMLTELGVRGTVAVSVLGPMGAADPAVLLAVTSLWAINVALPACVGSVILLLARVRTNSFGQ